jgi:RNA polymerase sigma-70 factor (ECF subfamily)
MYEMIVPRLQANMPALNVARDVERALADPAAFKPIYDEYFPRIYRYCLRRVSSPPDAEDLTSLTFTRALTSLGSYRGGSFAAWLFRIAHNTVVNHLRGRRPVVPLASAESLPVADEMLGQMMEREERQQVARLVAALPEEARDLLALKVGGNLSAKEIGQVIGKSEGAVRVMLHRIVQQLRTAWAEEQER